MLHPNLDPGQSGAVTGPFKNGDHAAMALNYLFEPLHVQRMVNTERWINNNAPKNTAKYGVSTMARHAQRVALMGYLHVAAHRLPLSFHLLQTLQLGCSLTG